MLRRLELSAAFADDLAAADVPGGLMIVSAGEGTAWSETEGQISILNSDRGTMTRVLVAAVRPAMTGPLVDLADFIPASSLPNGHDSAFENVYRWLTHN